MARVSKGHRYSPPREVTVKHSVATYQAVFMTKSHPADDVGPAKHVGLPFLVAASPRMHHHYGMSRHEIEPHRVHGEASLNGEVVEGIGVLVSICIDPWEAESAASERVVEERFFEAARASHEQPTGARRNYLVAVT